MRVFALVTATVLLAAIAGCKKSEGEAAKAGGQGQSGAKASAPAAVKAATAQRPAGQALGQKQGTQAAGQKALTQAKSGTGSVGVKQVQPGTKTAGKTQAAAKSTTQATASRPKDNKSMKMTQKVPATQEQFKETISKFRAQAKTDGNTPGGQGSIAAENSKRFAGARYSKPIFVYNASKREIKSIVIFYNDKGFMLKNIPSGGGMEDVLLTDTASVDMQIFITFADGKQSVIPKRRWNFAPGELSSIRVYDDGTVAFR